MERVAERQVARLMGSERPDRLGRERERGGPQTGKGALNAELRSGNELGN